MSDADRRLAAVARQQAGAFNRRQATEAGFTLRMVERRVATGQWRRLGTHVFADASHPHGWRQRDHAGLLAHPAGVLRGTTTAHVLGIDGFGPDRRPSVTVPSGHRATSELAVVRRSSLLRPRTVDGLRTNSPALTMLEVAADAPHQLEAAYQGAILLGRTNFDAVADVAARASAGRLRGAGHLRRLLADLGDGHVPPESELERLLHRLVRHPDIPDFEAQAPCPWAPTGPQRVDGFIAAWRLVVEVDGRRWHARIEGLAADRERDRLARHRGILVERFGWAEVHDDPAGCRASILHTAAAFGRRTAPPAG